jgi:hypothetical protein
VALGLADIPPPVAGGGTGERARGDRATGGSVGLTEKHARPVSTPPTQPTSSSCFTQVHHLLSPGTISESPLSETGSRSRLDQVQELLSPVPIQNHLGNTSVKLAPGSARTKRSAQTNSQFKTKTHYWSFQADDNATQVKLRWN